MNLEVGDIVMCTVEKISGTIVFVKIDGIGEGSITFSEISPGRIRNIRNFVVPKKKIICKVLRIAGDRINLSLRRVTQKEQKEIREQYKQEKSYKSILKSVLKEKAKDIIEKILTQEKVYEFLEEAKQNTKKLEDLVGKEDSQKIMEILNKQKKKEAIVKKEIIFTTTKPNGLKIIKETFNSKEAEIKYISAGRYSLKTTATDLKTADNKLKVILNEIENIAKKEKAEFHIKDKK